MSTLVTNGSFITNKLSDIMLTLTPIKPFKRNLAIFLSGRVLEYEINKKWMELFKTHFENDFNIRYNGEGLMSVSIYDVAGKLICNKDILFTSPQKTINVDAISSGVYLVKLQSKKLNYFTKLIKK